MRSKLPELRRVALITNEEICDRDWARKLTRKDYVDTKRHEVESQVEVGDQVLRNTKINKLSPNHDSSPCEVIDRNREVTLRKKDGVEVKRNVSFVRKYQENGFSESESVVPLQPIASTLESATPLQPIASTLESATPLQPIASTLESATPLQPIASTLESATPLQPIANPLESATPLQPIANPLESATPLQPLANPLESATPLQPIANPLESATPLQPIANPLESATPLQPIANPLDSATPLQPITSQPVASSISVQQTVNPSSPMLKASLRPTRIIRLPKQFDDYELSKA